LTRPTTDLAAVDWGPAVEVFRADLRSPSDLARALVDLDVVIHLAALLGGDDREKLGVAVGGTERLLEAMSRSSTRRLVLASSLAVYDWRAVRDVLTEDSPRAPADGEGRDSYSLAKIRQELLAEEWCERREWSFTALRPGFIWGPGRLAIDPAGRYLGRFCLVLAPGRAVPLTYVENCAQAFVLAAERPEAIGRSFNIVDGHKTTAWRWAAECSRHARIRRVRLPLPYGPTHAALELAQAVARRLAPGHPRLPGILSVPRFDAQFKPVTVSGEAIRRALGWKPRFGFEEALARTVEAQRVQPGTPRIADVRSA
jgi:UDP-glucose 4-epimerase